MPDLYYCAWRDAKEVGIGLVVAEGKVAIGGTSTASAVLDSTLGKKALYVRLWADGDNFTTWGAEGIEAAQDGSEGRPYASESPEYHWIRADHVIATIERV